MQATMTKPATAFTGYTIGSRRTGDRAYAGVLRRGRRIVLDCGHHHTNRDWTTGANGRSATDCIRQILAGATNPNTADHVAGQYRTSWQRLTTTGFQMPKSTIDAAKEQGARDADAYLAAVAAARALPVITPTEPKPTAVLEQGIGEMPDWMLG